MAAEPVRLTARVAPAELSSGDVQDLTVSLTLENPGPAPVFIYPGAARFSVVSGWLSPSWEIAFEPGDAFATELRSWYGPPGMPPAGKYFEDFRVKLKPGKHHNYDIPACWIPRSALTDEHLSRAALDPEGMEGLERDLTGSSVLVFHRGRNLVLRERQKRADFLRPGVLAFFPEPGSYRLVFTFSQQAWSGIFEPQDSLRVNSEPVEIVLPA